ncbi:MAG: NAD(P)-dependent oxidoreductase [Lachnospiraceae bacterium]|nr:NAD(P)-dependent oxidoreductase [Lachnospiraceae bacterium]
MIALVGYTGFVGSNIYAAGKVDKVFNSQNIEEAYGLCPELLIYAGLRAEKFLANTMPQKDMELIVQAQENIRKIAPKKLVLISTIDVFKNPLQVDEKSEIDCEDLHAYGYNRYRLECWVRENYPDALIIRLPGLFGINLKKNFIYDFIHVIPSLLKKDKFEELAEKDRDITDFYELQDNGFYKCRVLDKTEEAELKGKFKKLEFTALNFTDSRNVYQFYPLDRLWDDIQRALRAGLLLWHPATEPVLVSELYRALTGTDFVNELPGKPVYYDYRTIYAEIFGGKDGYISTGGQITDKIVEFVRGQE